MENTFIALSSPFNKSAIAIIRINGDKSLEITNSFLIKKVENSRGKRFLRKFYNNGQFIDEVVLNFYPAPHSYTGDDLIEIMCHGSVYIIEQIIASYNSKGVRYAGPGEFTRRALINSKLDFVKAESINELVNSENKLSHDSAINSYDGTVNKLFREIRKELNFLWANLEVDLDYPEFDNQNLDKSIIKCRIEKMLKSLKEINNNSESVLPFLKNITISIIGKPNVGKSTLLNALLKNNKAIVSDIPGTTRDVVEGEINIHNQKMKISDTAGVHSTEKIVEKEGIKKTFETIKKSNLIIHVSDDGEWEDMDIPKSKKIIYVYNKIDLIKNPLKSDEYVCISAKNNKIDTLSGELFAWVNEMSEIIADNCLINYRQWNICQLIQKKMEEWLEKFNAIQEDLHAFFLNEIKHLFDELLGKKIEDNLENTLFNHFCVGK